MKYKANENSQENLAFLITDKIIEENYCDLNPNTEGFGNFYLEIYMNVLTKLNNLNELKNKRTLKIK